MGQTYGIKDIERALTQRVVSSAFYGTVAAGSSETSVVDSVGGWTTNEWTDYVIQFTADTATEALRGQYQQITSNTSDTLTLASGLPAAPAKDDTYNIRSLDSAAANIKRIGGGSVPGNPIGTPGSAAPAASVVVAGEGPSGNVRTVLTDDKGRLTPQPPTLVWDAAGLAVTANTNAFTTSYQPPTAGRLRLLIGNLSTGSASIAYLSKTSNTAPTGGSAGTRLFALNGGTAVGAGDLYPTDGDGGDFAVTPNDSYNLQFGTGTTVDITATFYPVG